MWKVATVVASDTAASGERVDDSGPAIHAALQKRMSCEIAANRVVPDDIELLQEAMIELADRHRVDLLVTIGGTGLSPEDVTPEATRQVIDRIIPGMAEEMRRKAMESSRQAMLTRAICGTRGNTLIINLPGSLPEAQYCLDSIIDQMPNALQSLQEDEQHIP
jgi:molybdopterin adenylyltransferase